MRAFLFCAASVLPFGSCLAQQTPQKGRPLAIEDYYRIRSVGSPQLRQDGKWVAYTVSERIEESNGNRTETWIVRADGSAEPVRVKHRGKDVSNPRWTDGGLRLTHAD